MVWDLGKAMRKKEEFELRRLMEFDFRQRARATKLLARMYGLNKSVLSGEIALRTEADLLDLFTAQAERDRAQVAAHYHQCLAEARRQLIIEIGDPTPNRLG